MTCTIRPFAPRDLLGFEFRPEDEAEARAAGREGAAEAVLSGWEKGVVFTSVTPEGVPIHFFGRYDDEDGDTYVWMSSSPALHQHRIELIKGLYTVITKWQESSRLMYTYMNPKSVKHIRILRAMGFIAVGAVGYGGNPHNPYYEMVRISPVKE